MHQQKNVLVCPLDWGMGHATRCVPIINEFIRSGANVIIAADKRPLAFLKQEFPYLKFIVLAGYPISYQEKGSFALKMFLTLPKILMGVFNEHQALKKIIKNHQIDIVLSDNRYGLWNSHIKSIFITHQVLIKSPIKFKLFDWLLFQVNNTLVSRFNECWIPDFEGTENLSGDLSHKYNFSISSYFIGPLSRFCPSDNLKPEIKYDILAILSGPEPQRSIFEKMVLAELKNSHLKAIVVKGLPEEKFNETVIENISIYPHLPTKDLLNLMLSANLILSRSGYSTIMDMVILGKKAILVPTPGQTEQEYLSSYFFSKKIFFSKPQHMFNLKEAIELSVNFNGFSKNNNLVKLKERISYFLKS